MPHAAASSAPDWVAIDATQSRMRAWPMQGASPGAVQQMAGATVADLAARCGASATTPVVSCGLTWAPLVPVPASPAALAPAADPGAPAHAMIPGLSQASPAGWMRGGETRISGYLSLNPNWDGVVCLPGPRSHWAQVSAGEVVSFQSFLTGDLHAALRATPSLQTDPQTDGWDATAFDAGLDEALSRPERLAALLAAPGGGNASRLWGLLIGAELAAARRYWLGQNLAVIGDDDANMPYIRALESQGVPVTRTDDTRMVLAGLIAAWRRMKGKPT